VDPKNLKLTRYDDEIFEHTMKAFPELAVEPYDKLVQLDEDWMKSAEGKSRWREFIERWVFFFFLFSFVFLWERVSPLSSAHSFAWIPGFSCFAFITAFFQVLSRAFKP
jgi:hypothetical protein